MRLLVTLILSCLLFANALAEKAMHANTFFTDQPAVQDFINMMVTKHQFDKGNLIALFQSIPTRPIHIQKINSHVEQKSWYQYKPMFVNDERLKEGVQFWNKYQSALARAEKEYGVPASIIVATIGIESEYGKVKGNYRAIDALVNLAFNDTSRTTYFRKELESFLLLSRDQHVSPLTIKGSYAGAIGQPQFMPSSYRYYAVKFSGKLPIDLSNNEEDVIGSIANYYKKNDWRTGEPVALPLSLSHGQYQINLHDAKSMPLIKSMHYDPSFNNIVINSTTKASFQLVTLREHFHNDYWLVFHNFEVIKRYNRSTLYAMAIYQLSCYLKTLRGN